MNVTLNELTSKNIYIIPVGEYFKKQETACYLVYSPLANVFFLSLLSEIENMEGLLKEGKTSDVLKRLLDQKELPETISGESYDTFTTLHLLLNEKCNFRCKYCYSAHGRSSAEPSMENIQIILSYFLSSDRTAPKERMVMFMGGGEPMLSWDKLVQSTLLAEEIASKNDIKVRFSLSTNGSIINDQIIDFLKEHNFTVQISFEVLPDVQKNQRGMSDIVAQNLKRILETKIPNFVRSTITTENVDRIPEMVKYLRAQMTLFISWVKRALPDYRTPPFILKMS